MNYRVLMIEDETDLREVVREILSLEKIEVVEACNGHHALQILKQGVSFDLILLDWNMPVLGGAGFLEELYLQREKPPVIVMSANEPPQSDQYSYISKPFRIEVFLRLIMSQIRKN
jgi:CheY-like chemotaxis protein